MYIVIISLKLFILIYMIYEMSPMKFFLTDHTYWSSINTNQAIVKQKYHYVFSSNYSEVKSTNISHEDLGL